MKRLFLIKCAFLCFCLTACSKHDTEAEGFIKSIEQAFLSGAQEIKLSEVTDFEWDAACFFHYDDDEWLSYRTYENYIKFINQKDFPEENTKTIRKAKYRNVFLFLYKGKPVKVYGLFGTPIELSRERYHLSIKHLLSNEIYGQKCTTGSHLVMKKVASERYEGFGNIYILNTKESGNG